MGVPLSMAGDGPRAFPFPFPSDVGRHSAVG